MFDRLLAQKAAENLEKLKAKKPLIHNITNFVVMNYTANALLACGASPVMAHAQEEVEEMVALADTLVLNIGTPTPYWIESMLKAGKKANEADIPIILDPVGSGATRLRTDSAKRLIDELAISVIRGNASEVLSLAHEESQTKGVDSIHSVEDAAETAVILARELKSTLAITGAVDLVTDGKTVYRVFNGNELMIGAFLAVDSNPAEAAATGLSYFGLSGEKAAAETRMPGSFQTALLDALYAIDKKQMEKGAKIQKLKMNEKRSS
jgi:hydroxyethylthiazole kinase